MAATFVANSQTSESVFVTKSLDVYDFVFGKLLFGKKALYYLYDCVCRRDCVDVL